MTRDPDRRVGKIDSILYDDKTTRQSDNSHKRLALLCAMAQIPRTVVGVVYTSGLVVAARSFTPGLFPHIRTLLVVPRLDCSWTF